MCAYIFKVNSNTMDKSNDIKQLREQIRKLDERLDCEIQVRYATANVESHVQTSCVLARAFLHVGAGPRGAGLGRGDGVCGEPS